MLDPEIKQSYYCSECRKEVEESGVENVIKGSDNYLVHKTCRKIVTIVNKKTNIIIK